LRRRGAVAGLGIEGVAQAVGQAALAADVCLGLFAQKADELSDGDGPRFFGRS
jgi:hypothetical protein